MDETSVPRITVEELCAMLTDAAPSWWLVHATDHAHFNQGHIPGALARPGEAQLRELGHRALIVVYGEDEHARTAPALAAALAGDVTVAWFAGGLTAWATAGLPIDLSG